MNLYTFMSVGYDLLDKIWFSDKGENPRRIIERLISDRKCRVLDMCCGTFSNGLPIANKNPKNTLVGLDRSESMLKEAKKKTEKANLRNVKLLCRDATQTSLESNYFNYIIIGLVIHECNADLWNGILKEAHRLLKNDGKLIVLEWDKQTKISRKIKFAPLYAVEILVNPKYFRKFYNSDKRKFFRKFGFEIVEKYECNYTAVMSMEKI